MSYVVAFAVVFAAFTVGFWLGQNMASRQCGNDLGRAAQRLGGGHFEALERICQEAIKQGRTG